MGFGGADNRDDEGGLRACFKEANHRTKLTKRAYASGV